MMSSLMKIRNRFDYWKEISRQRRELRAHSNVLAKDMGISRATLDREANRPFWDDEPGPVDAFPSGQKSFAV